MKKKLISPENIIIPEDYHFNIQDMILKEMFNCQEKVIKEVLRQLLKREPVLEDAKRLTRYEYEGVFEYYDLAFDGVKIGRVVSDVNKDYKVTFEPVEMFK